MRVLLDTNVISELHARPTSRVSEQLKSLTSANVFISAITIGEIAYGIERLPESAKRQKLAAWLLTIENGYQDRILPFDAETAKIWGSLQAKLRNKGINTGAIDIQIASIALRNGLHLMTRNVKDFDDTGVLIVNPWDDA